MKFSFIKADSCQLLTHSIHEEPQPSPLMLHQGLFQCCCLPLILPSHKAEHEGQLAKTPLLLLKAQATFPGWELCPILALCVPHQLLRGLCTLEGCRGPPAPSGSGLPPAHPGDCHRQEHIRCGCLASAQETSGQGSSDHASAPGHVLVPCPPKHSADSWA